jgi:hypothetical protein
LSGCWYGKNHRSFEPQNGALWKNYVTGLRRLSLSHRGYPFEGALVQPEIFRAYEQPKVLA